MAGARKHMERSHYSYGKSNEGVFYNFHRKAAEASYAKEQRLGIGQRLAKFLRRSMAQ